MLQVFKKKHSARLFVIIMTRFHEGKFIEIKGLKNSGKISDFLNYIPKSTKLKWY